jgi:chemotaxis protein methyltransferase CheR
LPELLASRAKRRRLTLWSAGCSTGEEPYTLAILLREQLQASKEWQLDIFATDLSEAALATARRACYREWSFRETPAQARSRYFTRQGDAWHLDSAIRQMVRFGRLNLIADPFPSPGPGGAGYDLILCRNVTIYFSPPVSRRLYERFAAALAPDGWLILGPSDPPPPDELFAATYQPGAVLWRKRSTVLPPPPHAPAPRAVARVPRRQGGADNTDTAPRRRHTTVGTIPPQSRQQEGVGPATSKADSHEADLTEMRALIQAGEREGARVRLVQLVQSAPLAADAHRLLGFLALADGQTSEALESLRRATFLAPDDALAQYGLGRAFRARGDYGRARAAFRQARRILASWPGNQVIPGDDGLSADDLRARLEAQLAVVGDSPGGED